MLSATMALNDMIAMGVTQDWATHRIGHELTALHELTHGASLASFSTARCACSASGSAINCCNTANVSGESRRAMQRIASTFSPTEAFFRSPGLSTRLSREKIGAQTVAEIERRFDAAGVACGQAQNVDGAIVRRILEACM